LCLLEFCDCHQDVAKNQSRRKISENSYVKQKLVGGLFVPVGKNLIHGVSIVKIIKRFPEVSLSTTIREFGRVSADF